MVALLSGQHLVHDVGYVEAGLTVSPEMIVFTADVIGRMRHFMAGIDLSPEAFALDLIEAIGPGGSYLTSEHTLHHFKEFWQPTLYSRLRHGDWLKKGGKDLGQRLREQTVALMDKARVFGLETVDGERNRVHQAYLERLRPMVINITATPQLNMFGKAECEAIHNAVPRDPAPDRGPCAPQTCARIAPPQ